MGAGSVAGVVSSVEVVRAGADVRHQLEFASRPAPRAEVWQNFSMSFYKFEIDPLVGVGPVRFGMCLREAREILKGIDISPALLLAHEDWYLDHRFGIQFTDGDEDTAQVYGVELENRSPVGPIKAMFHGKDLLEISYEECRQHLLQFSSSGPACDDFWNLGFPELDIMLWNDDYLARHRHIGHFNVLSSGRGTAHEWDLIQEQSETRDVSLD